MSIESILERIAVSAERSELLLGKILGRFDDLPDPAAAEPFGTASQEPPVPAPAPVPPPAPTPVPAPIPAPALSTVVAPFTDAKGLMDYVMTKYKELGPIKGGMIQQVLLDLGHSNMSSVPASQYADFYLKVEAL